VLKRENDTIGIDNLESVSQQLTDYKIEVVARSVMGTERKSVRFDIKNRIIYCSKGDGSEKELYHVLKNSQILMDS